MGFHGNSESNICQRIRGLRRELLRRGIPVSGEKKGINVGG